MDATHELDPNVDPVNLDSIEFHGSMQKGKGEGDSNCWTSPSGAGFKIRGKTYLKDSAKVTFCFFFLYKDVIFLVRDDNIDSFACELVWVFFF